MVEGRVLADERPKADSTSTMTVVLGSNPFTPDGVMGPLIQIGDQATDTPGP